MKKFVVGASVLTLLGITTYIAYRLYLPVIVAQSITSDNVFIPMPVPVKEKIKKIKKPVNESAGAVIETMHKSGITIEEILKAIDNVTEDQAYAMLEELNNTEIKDTDQVFDLAKKHFPVDFNVEALRKPFNQHVSLRHIKKGLYYANTYKDAEELDPRTAKSIAKKILLQKEEEFNRIMRTQEN